MKAIFLVMPGLQLSSALAGTQEPAVSASTAIAPRPRRLIMISSRFLTSVDFSRQSW
jgi:hypothetical protein